MSDYASFIRNKTRTTTPTGVSTSFNQSHLFDFQSAVVDWALRRGRCAIWADCGLGKTRMSIVWANAMHESTGMRALILTPLAVASQFVDEGVAIGIDVQHVRSPEDVGEFPICVVNYERLHMVDADEFGIVVCDESSCLKDYTSKTRNALIDVFKTTRYRLACTATPSPNDVMELGNHAEFLGVMSRSEMLSMYFVHDGGETQKWRLKKHAVDPFWKWVSSWAASFRMPGDIGYPNDGYELPPLNMTEILVDAPDGTAAMSGRLFVEHSVGLMEQRRSRRASIQDRVKACADIANSHDRPFIAWCDMNDESRSLCTSIEGSIEITGSMSLEDKEARMDDFSSGRSRVLVTKPSICGWGVNWQHCSDVAFVGLSHSFEAWYQAIRRTWRFGQTMPVSCHIITSELDGAVLANIKRKHREADAMAEAMSAFVKSEIKEVSIP